MHIIWIAIISVCCLTTGADPKPRPDPENERLSSETFRRGLQQLGLTDLLDYYMREYPPENPLQAQLLQRELQLNIYADASLPVDRRLVALEKATEILRALIHQYPEHEDHHQWMLSLGRDLIDRKAEPYYNAILFRGGTEEDRHQLALLTLEALGVYEQLIAKLGQEIAQVDQLSIREFEQRARSGRIKKIEQTLPRAQYFSMWASYYHCLTLPAGSAERTRRLNEIVDYLVDQTGLTEIEHEISHYQAQSLLLAGMAYRLLSSSDRAEEYLSRASSTAATLPGYTDRQAVKWVVHLAELERVKNYRDRNQFEMALIVLARLRSSLSSDNPETLGLQLALALLEGSIYTRQLEQLPAEEFARRGELQLKVRQPLIELARAHPAWQDAIYQNIFEMLGDVEDFRSLDSFEKSVYLAGLLRNAREADSSDQLALRDELLDQAIEVAKSLLADASSLADAIRPEAHFNLAVCYYERGRVLQSIEQFNRIVYEHPTFEKARTAADYAIRLAQSLYAGEASQRQRVGQYYAAALEGLLKQFPEDPLSKKYRFSYAQFLQEQGRYEEAVHQYGLISVDHERYLESQVQRSVCQLELLRSYVIAEDPVASAKQATRAIECATKFLSHYDSQSTPEQKHFVGQTMLIKAEAQVLSPTIYADAALRSLAEFDVLQIQDPSLVGQAMRIRILAYQKLGRLEEAAAIIPDYIRQDPIRAGSTLQSVLVNFRKEIQDARQRDQQDLVRLKSEQALIVARALYEWSVAEPDRVSSDGRWALQLQLGESLLQAGEAQEALALFASMETQPGNDVTQEPRRQGPVLLGLADAHLLLDDPKTALSRYHQLLTQSAENSDLWWRALLGELRCRQRLEQEPNILYKIIRQKEYLFPEMGGPTIKKEFEELKNSLHGG